MDPFSELNIQCGKFIAYHNWTGLLWHGEKR